MLDNDDPGLSKTAYEAHYRLVEHYSSLVLRARVSIVTLTLAAVAFAFGVMPNSVSRLDSTFGMDSRSPVALLAALFLSLLFLMEVGYLKRFYQIIASGRALESEKPLSTYFSKYDAGESWPIYCVYFLAVLVLVAIFVRLSLDRGHAWWQIATVTTLALVPIVITVYAYLKSRSIATILALAPALQNDQARKTKPS